MVQRLTKTRLLLLLTVLFTPLVLTAPHPVQATPAAAYSDHILVIMMENHDRSEIIPIQPYETQYANAHSQLTSYSQSSDYGSLPNYVGALSGLNPSWAYCDAQPSACPGLATGGSKEITILDRLDSAGLPWKSYMEDMNQNCYDPQAEYSSGPGGGIYYPRHNPFIYYHNIISNPSECAKNIPAGNSCVSAANTILQVSSCVSNLLTDLNSASAPSFMWLSPNGCNQAHDCNGFSDAMTAAAGDKYLSILLPLILRTNTFTSPGSNAAVFVTYDECGACNDRSLYAVWAGPRVSTQYVSNTAYNHYSLLKTLEENWNLASLGTGDVSAWSMTEVFNAAAAGNFNQNDWNKNAIFPSTVTIAPGTGGVLSTRVSNLANDYSSSYYSVGLEGTADWSTSGATIPGTYLSLDGTFVSMSLAGGPVTDFKVEASLYYHFQYPQAGTSCDQWRTNISWLDIQLQFSHYDSTAGGYQSSGSYVGCAGPNSISYRETLATTTPGHDFSLSNFDTKTLYQRALAAQHLSSTVPANLVGAEAGVEGYNINDLSAVFRHFTLGPVVLSNYPKDKGWTTQGNGWTQSSGKLQAQGYWPEIISTTAFRADRTVTVSARTIVGGGYNWDTAWVRGKYVDDNNKISMALRQDKYLEIDVKKNGGYHYYLSQSSTGKLPGDWHTFTMVFSNDNIKGYLDGILYLDLSDPLFATFQDSSIMLTTGATSIAQFDNITIS